MKLYTTPRAPNPRRVAVFLAEKGLAIATETVDIMKGGHRGLPFTAISPFERVPVLVLDDGTAIAESIAICRWAEEVRPEPPLFGTGAVGRATVEMWQRLVEFELLGPIASVFRHMHPAMKELESPQIPQWAEANRPRVARALAVLDRHLADRPFLAGDAFSVADITALVAVDFMKPARLPPPSGLAHLGRWYEAVSARPSAQAGR